MISCQHAASTLRAGQSNGNETMDSETIRSTVKQFAPSQRSIWPNGAGFTWYGWEYNLNCIGWCAMRSSDGTIGFGDTPLVARSHAVDGIAKVS
jgi:hypothetical protein